jgi:predicted RNA-binding protein with EMAP domain
MMFYGGIKLLFRIRYTNRWLNFSAGILWLTGIVIVVFVSVKTAGDFSESGRVKDQVTIHSQKDTLYLTLSDIKRSIPEVMLNEEDYEQYHRHGKIRVYNRNRDYVVGTQNNRQVIVGYSSLRIVEANTDKFALFIVKRAQGPDKRTAMQHAKNISYNITQRDSLISFDDIFVSPHSGKFWAQDVEVILEVPKGKVVYLDKSLEHFLNDVENVTNTYDRDMVGRRWAMTKRGLECLDCEGLEIHEEIDEHDHDHHGLPEPPMPPDPHTGVNIDAKDANVKIDKDGNINVKSKDTEVKVGKDGISVDKRKDKH